MSRTMIEKGTNTVGKVFALVRDSDGTFSVWTLAENYAGHVRGGIAKSWRYCAKGMAEDDARAMYAKKLKGKARH